MTNIGDHPLVERTIETGYPEEERFVCCADCGGEFYGSDKMYEFEGNWIARIAPGTGSWTHSEQLSWLLLSGLSVQPFKKFWRYPDGWWNALVHGNIGEDILP